MISSQMFSEWLDAVFPDWYPLSAAILTGAFGVLAIGLLVLGFAPHALFMWMPVIAAFCGVAAGYKFREKQKSDRPAILRILGPAAGLGPAAAAIIIQNLVDSRIFKAETSVKLEIIILACAVLGAFAGKILRGRYEKSVLGM
ncbi:MAG: hypothetical protein ACLFUN_07000 [Desulfobacterales bacterium]